MDRTTVSLRTGSWCGDRTVPLAFPSDWKITVHSGAVRPPLDDRQVEAVLASAGDGVSLAQLLKRDASVAIVIDDHTRPTPAADVLRPLLKAIRDQGVPNANIKIVVALGTHILRDRSFMRNKLGSLMDDGVQVVFPDCRDRTELILVGHSSTGIPIYVNRCFAEADVKIAVSGVYPHDEAGFSGGAKILTGVLGLETLSRFHRRHGLLERGSVVDSDFRREIESFADIVGLDFSVNCVINDRKELTDLFVGDFRTAFRRAVACAQTAFATVPDPDADVVVSNAYPLDTSLSVLGKSRWPFGYCKESAFKVIVTSLCQCSHQRVALASTRTEALLQWMKRYSGATAAKRAVRSCVLRVRSLRSRGARPDDSYVVYVPFVERLGVRRPRSVDGRIALYDWNHIVDEITDRYGHEHPVRVSVYPHAPLLYSSRAV